MQANFIESNPLPVKAVLAMMGRIEEVYRLPLLPMRRDTRSKLQKIATEAGLISQLPAPSPEAAEFLCLRELAGRAAQGRASPLDCGQCNHGKGARRTRANHARWHGPYGSGGGARWLTIWQEY